MSDLESLEIFESEAEYADWLPLLTSFDQPSRLDQLTALTLNNLFYTDETVNILSTYLSRTKSLTHLGLVISFPGYDESDDESEDKDPECVSIAPVISAISNSESIESLSLTLQKLDNLEHQALVHLIAQNQRVNDMNLEIVIQKQSQTHEILDSLMLSQSIVKFKFENENPALAYPLDLPTFERTFRANTILNDIDISTDVLSDDIPRVARRIFDSIPGQNLERFVLEGCVNTRGFSYTEDFKDLIYLARTFCGSKLNKRTVFPPELFQVVLFAGFVEEEEQIWYEDQLLCIIKSLLDRRTLGLVLGEVLPISQSYLFVRCRDALEKIKGSG